MLIGSTSNTLENCEHFQYRTGVVRTAKQLLLIPSVLKQQLDCPSSSSRIS